MKEWRSQKELDDYILKENRYDVIGYVTWKTLKKWGYQGLEKEWITFDTFYIIQNGNSISYHVKFRKRQDYKDNNNEMTMQTKSYNINEIKFDNETLSNGKRYIKI